MERRKAPLYRKENRTARGARRSGGDFRHTRHSKRETREGTHGAMHGRSQHGLDYTPLFRFLLARVGEDWDAVYGEAVLRLDHEEPIFHLVARTAKDRQDVVRIGESAYYSGLYIDPENRLRRVNPDLTEADPEPSCPCCTHTFNGVPFVKRYRPP